MIFTLMCDNINNVLKSGKLLGIRLTLTIRLFRIMNWIRRLKHYTRYVYKIIGLFL